MFWLMTCFVCLPAVEIEPVASTAVIVVVGEPGEEQYQELFLDWAERWQAAAAKAGSGYLAIGSSESKSADRADREILRESLAAFVNDPPETLWIVLIGHGTFDGKKAKFNLRGADITATELADRLAPLSSRTAIINCSSASGPFINRISGSNRVVVSATNSGFEQNFARFGGYLSHTIDDASADLDKDGQTSLLEAWLAAAKQTQEHYESESQLATEHTLLDDNGDGKGTPADWFRGIHLTKASQEDLLPDGTFANQFILVPGKDLFVLPEDMLRERNQLERQLAQLRQQKQQFSEREYLSHLEKILVPLAKIYLEAKKLPAEKR